MPWGGGGTDAPAFAEWMARWHARLACEDVEASRAAMRRANPAVIPRNHLVEEALAAATRGDFGPWETLGAVLANPYDDRPPGDRFAAPPEGEAQPYVTFCGT